MVVLFQWWWLREESVIILSANCLFPNERVSWFTFLDSAFGRSLFSLGCYYFHYWSPVVELHTPTTVKDPESPRTVWETRVSRIHQLLGTSSESPQGAFQWSRSGGGVGGWGVEVGEVSLAVFSYIVAKFWFAPFLDGCVGSPWKQSLSWKLLIQAVGWQHLCLQAPCCLWSAAFKSLTSLVLSEAEPFSRAAGVSTLPFFWCVSFVGAAGGEGTVHEKKRD